MDLGLANRVVMVTGGSRGIGLATVDQFVQEGARVALTYYTDNSASTTNDFVSRTCRSGGEAMALRLDLGSPESIRVAADKVLGRWGVIHVLVNNAVSWGLRHPSTAPAFEHLSQLEWRKELRANIEGPFALTQMALPSMREARWGRIVYVSSSAAVDGLTGATWYSAAKASLHGLTSSLAKEVGPSGILVNTVVPGLTLTERVVQNVAPTTRQRIETLTPIRRLLEPVDIARAIVFLCSTANSGITGQIIRVNGGHTS